MKSARETILEKLKKAVHSEPDKPDFEKPVWHPVEEPLELTFRENLEKIKGNARLFSSEEEMFGHLKTFLAGFREDTVFCMEDALSEKLSRYGIPFTKAGKLPDNIQVGITGCEFLVAHTGSVMVSSAQKGGRQLFIYPPVHVVIASKNQLVPYLEQAYAGILEKYNDALPSQISLITGPSRTADIEKTLVMGAHGPRELHVFIV